MLSVVDHYGRYDIMRQAREAALVISKLCANLSTRGEYDYRDQGDGVTGLRWLSLNMACTDNQLQA